MQITFLGAIGTVTGSKTLLETENHSLLIDCGMYQGHHSEQVNHKPLNLESAELDFIILTHAHLDHSGFLPVLVKQGFQGKILCTEATYQIAKIILEDSVRVQQSHLKDNPQFQVLYDEIDVSKTLSYFQTVIEGESLIFDDIQIHFYEAGHILGASQVLIENKGQSILFSGDLGRAKDRIHKAPKLVEADHYIVESTYGDRIHSSESVVEKLAEHIKKIKETNGVLLVPAFAVARSQMFIQYLDDVFNKYPNCELPIFLDSPMTSKVTKIYIEHLKELSVDEDDFSKALKRVKFLDYGNDHKKFKKAKRPFILISSSGMISGGKVLRYFDMFAKSAENTVLLTGYQGEGTIGNKVLAGEKSIKLFGHTMTVKANIDLLEGLSAHADYTEIISHLKKLKNTPKYIFLNHGDNEARQNLKEKIEYEFDTNVIIAHKNTIYPIGE